MIAYLAHLGNRVPAILRPGRAIQVRDDLLQILAHPGQLPVQVLGQLQYIVHFLTEGVLKLSPHVSSQSSYRVGPLSLRVCRPCCGKAGLKWFEYLLQLGLLGRHKVQFVVESLLVHPNRRNAIV